jgi:hypothetical protein
MGRFRVMQAFYSDAVGVGKVSAGRVVSSSAVGAQPGDVVWEGLTSHNLPAGLVPLDLTAQEMRAASQWANTPISATILGSDSIG